MGLFKWVVLIAIVALAAVVAARRIKAFRERLMREFPELDRRPPPGNIWGARGHLNSSDDSQTPRGTEPGRTDETRRS